MAFFAFARPLHAQGLECSLDVPATIVQQLIEKKPAIDEFIANLENEEYAAMGFSGIPVRFTVINGPNSPVASVTQGAIDDAIDYLNQAFAASGLTFFQCSDLNEIWDDRIRTNVEIDQQVTSFAYASGTMEVLIKFDGIDPYAPIPEQAYLSNNPNYPVAGVYQHTNFVKLTAPWDLAVTFAHETGHHFGLLHTHMMATALYQSPPASNANDYPYPVKDIYDEIIPTWWGRELVMRINDNNKAFPEHNFEIAGDLVEDTPADCTRFPSLYPGCPISAQNQDCDFNQDLTYVDYNGDAIYPPPSGTLGRNYMSYWRLNCLDQFTSGQMNRVKFYYATERAPGYTADRCGTFTDKVELEDSGIGLHNVSIRVRHTSGQKCNVTSGKFGDFSGLLHQDNLKAYMYHNGKKNTLAFAQDPLKVHYGHTRCEWIRGVNVGDLLRISQHILGINSLENGYRIIAADANKSNGITTFDNVELRKLILGIYWDYLPEHEQPWRYIAEFVPQNNATQFDADPFSLLGGDYLEQGWSYSIPGAGQRGFDGIKIGDVDFSWNGTGTVECENEGTLPGSGGATLSVPTTAIAQGDTVALTVKIQNTQQLAFQLGLKVPASYFEILDVRTHTLPNYNKADNFGINLLEEDALTTLWFDTSTNVLVLPDTSALFTLIVKTKQPVDSLHRVIRLDNQTLPILFLRTVDTLISEPVALSVIVAPAIDDRTSDGRLNAGGLGNELRCEPNPTQGPLRIVFANTAHATQGLLNITDMAGNLVYQYNTPLLPGENVFKVDALGKLPVGMYVVSLATGAGTYTSRIQKI